jgi:hypothetical protein
MGTITAGSIKKFAINQAPDGFLLPSSSPLQRIGLKLIASSEGSRVANRMPAEHDPASDDGRKGERASSGCSFTAADVAMWNLRHLPRKA